jgi:streptogramin lyase
VVLALVILVATHTAPDAHTALAGAPFLGTTNAPEVSVALDLHDPNLHPRQLVYDEHRNGLWFWTSTQDRGVKFDNRVYLFDLATRHLRSWPLSVADWSSQLLAGLAVGPDGTVWIGFNHHLLAFHPSTGTFERYELPAEPQFPLPGAVLHGLPSDLGIADVVAAADGTVWLARYAAQSLTSFSPASHRFTEHALPASAGDPAKLAIGPEGHLYFTIDLSAALPGYVFDRVGEYDPSSGATWVYLEPANALAVGPSGDLYTVRDGPTGGLARLSASDRANARALQRQPAFVHRLTPFPTDSAALAVDPRGRVWMAVAGQPEIAVLDPSTGQAHQFQYAAPSVAAHPHHSLPGVPDPAYAPTAVWLSHMAVMTCDGQGHLWYIRAGNDTIEEVAA